MDVNPAAIQGSGNQQPVTYVPAKRVASDSVETKSNVTIPPASSAQVKDAVDKINKVIQSLGKDLKFSVDESTGINVVQVVDTSTKEVIRQFPSVEALHIAQGLDKLQGLLLKHKA